MNNAAQIITPYDLKDFELLKRLSTNDAQELLNTSLSNTLSAGTPIFRREDNDKQMFYLIDGEVELETDSHGTRIIRAGTPAARHPLGCHLPGQLAATAHSDCTLLSFDADMLELFMSWTAPGSSTNYQVSEVTGNNNDAEWTNRLLRSRGLLRFSEDHIQTLLNRMQEVHLNAGEVVIRQDGDDDNYYIIKSGRASVSRQPSPEMAPVKLAELESGDAFGEEALLANMPRSATITMEESGSVMALSKKDFSELLATPFLNTVSWEECEAMLGLGSALVDVRQPDEFEQKRTPGSINLPLAILRLKLKRLDKQRKYILVCDDGSRASVAAFLLNRHGFDAYTVDGGLSAAPQLTGAGARASKPKAKAPTPEIAPVAPAPKIKPENKAKAAPSSLGKADHWGDIITDRDLFNLPAKSSADDKTKAFVSRVKPANDTPVRESRRESAGVQPVAFTAAPKVSAAPVKKPQAQAKGRRWGIIAIAALGLITLPPLAQIGMYSASALFSGNTESAIIAPANEAIQPVMSTTSVAPTATKDVTTNPIVTTPKIKAAPPVPLETQSAAIAASAPSVASSNSEANFGLDEFTAGTPQTIIMAAPPASAPLDPATRGLAN